MDTLVRCFLAVRIPDALLEPLVAVQADIRRRAGGGEVRWVGTDQMHLTLCFLGEVSVQQLVSIQSIVGPICKGCTSLVLSLGKVSGLPNAVQPRVVIVEIEGDLAPLVGLQASLQAAVRPFASQLDTKPFHPHITLGRLKTESEMARTGIGRALRMVPAPSSSQFEVGHVELIRSDLGPTGPTYTLVQSFGLG